MAAPHTIEEGEITNVIEPYYFVTSETPYQLNHLPMYSIISTEYEPMEKGRTYLVYMFNDIHEVYYYNGGPILAVAGFRESVYDLSLANPLDSMDRTVNLYRSITPAQYSAMFQEALAMYGDIFREVVERKNNEDERPDDVINDGENLDSIKE